MIETGLRPAELRASAIPRRTLEAATSGPRPCPEAREAPTARIARMMHELECFSSEAAGVLLSGTALAVLVGAAT
jgi:hypothetical protein